MGPISRRRALQFGALGTAGVVVGGWGLARQFTSPGSTRTPSGGGAALTLPPELVSSGGVLEVELDAAPRTLRVGGERVTMLGYADGVPGPTLRLRPGDRLQIRLRNGLDEATNLHVHGLHVSPEGNGDNPFVVIEPGQGFDYSYQLPPDHPAGTYWYHPHLHGTVADQVFGGLYGAVVVEEDDPVPVARERVLVVSDVSFDGAGNVRPASQQERMMGREGDLLLVNGQVAPVLEGRPGERERWRVVNACTSRYLRLVVDGQRFQLLGMDLDRSPVPEEVDEVVLAPGNRADLLVTLAEGSTTVRTRGYDRGSMGGMMSATSGPATLATLAASGDAVTEEGRLPDVPTSRDLRTGEVDRRRELTMEMDMGMGMRGRMMSFTIDGREFDHERTDQQVAAGTIEEWTIRNTSPMDHPFHLHVWPMQVLEERGQVVKEPRWRDVIDVPADGQVVVRIPFEDYPGRTVYHCHILDHEDLGMMGVIDVR